MWDFKVDILTLWRKDINYIGFFIMGFNLKNKIINRIKIMYLIKFRSHNCT